MNNEGIDPVEGGSSAEELLTIDEAAKFLDTSKSTLYRLLGQGDLKGTKVGKQWRFRKPDLTSYLERTPVQLTIDSAARADLDAVARSIGMDVDADLEAASEDGQVIRIAHHIVKKAITDKASDIHVEPVQQGVRVRYRIDGVLHETMTFPKSIQEAVIARFKIMADLNIMEKRMPQDGRTPIKHDGKDYDIRMSVLPTFFGENVVMRILDKSSALLGVNKLGFESNDQRAIERWMHKSSGTIIATGPTGAGKTTLLYSLLQMINSDEKKVVTIEDPVEYILPGITQVAVNRRAGLTFPEALRSFLRQDPDVIMCGEQRSLESAQICVEAALTGHVVLTTLHTEDAPSALVRLADMGIEKYLVAATVCGVVSTRLARKVCDQCKSVADPDEIAPIIEKVRSHAADGGYHLGKNAVFYEAVGCEECRGTGYRGRVGIHEVLTCTPRLVNQLLQCNSAEEMSQLAVQSGMRTLLADGMSKAVAGVTTIDEVLRSTGTWL